MPDEPPAAGAAAGAVSCSVEYEDYAALPPSEAADLLAESLLVTHGNTADERRLFAVMKKLLGPEMLADGATLVGTSERSSEIKTAMIANHDVVLAVLYRLLVDNIGDKDYIFDLCWCVNRLCYGTSGIDIVHDQRSKFVALPRKMIQDHIASVVSGECQERRMGREGPVQNACRAINRLCESNGGFMEAFVKAGVVAELVGALEEHADDERILEVVAFAINKMCNGNRFFQQYFLDEDVLAKLFALVVRHRENKDVLVMVLRAVARMCHNFEPCSQLLVGGGYEVPLVDVMSLHVASAPIVASNGCWCVGNASEGGSTRRGAFVAAGACKVMIRALELHPTNEELVEGCCIAVGKLCGDDESVKRIFSENGFEEILKTAVGRLGRAGGNTKPAVELANFFGCGV